MYLYMVGKLYCTIDLTANLIDLFMILDNTYFDMGLMKRVCSMYSVQWYALNKFTVYIPLCTQSAERTFFRKPAVVYNIS